MLFDYTFLELYEIPVNKQLCIVAIRDWNNKPWPIATFPCMHSLWLTPGGHKQQWHYVSTSCEGQMLK